MASLSVFAAGRVGEDALAPLRQRFDAVEVQALPLPAGASFGRHQAEIRAALTSAGHDWVLLLHEGESVPAPLADAMARALAAPPRAWGFRLGLRSLYRGAPLTLRSAPQGEIRLFHRRHMRLDLRSRFEEMQIEGAVIRLDGSLERTLWASSEEHARAKARAGVPHSRLRHLLVFLRRVSEERAWGRPNALRYLWIEAGWEE